MNNEYNIIPLHVTLCTHLFKICYPLYRLIYFSYKKIIDRRLLYFLQSYINRINSTNKSNQLIILDIGANIGFFSRFFGTYAGPHSVTYAFEPVSANLCHLHEEIKLFSNVLVIPKAVSDYSGELKLTISDKSIVDHHIEATCEGKAIEGICVPCVTVDDICADIPSVNIIKIDIQGSECHALRGMRHTLERSPQVLIIMELWPWGLTRAGSSYEEFFAIIRDFKLYAHAFDGSDIETFCRLYAKHPRKYINIFLHHNTV
jgi:FkbM family methyltransferase